MLRRAAAAVLIARLQQLGWGVEQLLAGHSQRGWLLRLHTTSRLELLPHWVLAELLAAARELALPAAAGGGEPGGDAAGVLLLDEGGEGGKTLAAGLRGARRLQEALGGLLPGLLARCAAEGDAAALERAVARLGPLVVGGEEPLRQLELAEELQVGGGG